MKSYRSPNVIALPWKTGIRHSVHAFLVVCLLLMPALFAWSADTASEEVKIGKEEADRYAADKSTKFVEDKALLTRVQTIGDAIAKVANERVVPASYGKSTVNKFDYTFKIVDDKDINAFSLPGGFIYVNKGLVDYAQSDDELAGVIAHEIAHVSHHHAIQLVATQNKQMVGVAGALIVAALSGVKSDELFKLMQLGGLIAVAKTSAYGQKAEFDADRTAVAYMSETKYNPVGMLTFMEKLARDEGSKPEINYGIFATHPRSDKRAHEIVDEIGKRGLPINRRLVTSYTEVLVKPVPDSGAVAVWISKTEVIRLADAGGRKASARADSVAEQLRRALLAGARIRDVRVGGGDRYVTVFGEIVIAPTPEDAALAGITVAQLTNSASNHIKQALMNEMLQQGF